jgi:hypothetical protein
MPRYITQATTIDNPTSNNYYGSGTCLVQVTGGPNGFEDIGATGGANAQGPGSSGYCLLWTVPSGVCSLTFEIWGGGGGGGSNGGCICCNHGFGGGGGGYSRVNISTVPGCQYTICAGAGGSGGGKGTLFQGSNLCCCGCRGGCTYVTGFNLSNFCAEGGYGGESRCVNAGGWVNANGACAFGGNLNMKGEDGGMFSVAPYGCRLMTWGGGSPFGGKRIMMGYSLAANTMNCGSYPRLTGQDRSGGICGFTGMFPGGGGTGAVSSCCCGMCACGGDGAPGLVRIWM